MVFDSHELASSTAATRTRLAQYSLPFSSISLSSSRWFHRLHCQSAGNRDRFVIHNESSQQQKLGCSARVLMFSGVFGKEICRSKPELKVLTPVCITFRFTFPTLVRLGSLSSRSGGNSLLQSSSDATGNTTDSEDSELSERPSLLQRTRGGVWASGNGLPMSLGTTMASLGQKVLPASPV